MRTRQEARGGSVTARVQRHAGQGRGSVVTGPDVAESSPRCCRGAVWPSRLSCFSGAA